MGGHKIIVRGLISVFVLVLFCLNLNAAIERPKFKTSSTGLQYLFLSKGNGPLVQKSHRVFIRYTTKLNNDSVIFDQSTGDDPYKFIVGEGEGLAGWDEALLLMHIGDSAIFRIPPSLGFGNKKVGRIPANSGLVFAVCVLRQEEAYYPIHSLTPVKLDSGLLKYEVDKRREKPVLPFSMVEMNFTGYFKDEKGNRRIFESSKTNSNKAVFQTGVGKMVRGLDLGIAAMSVGEKATFELAPYMAFGTEKNGLIPPNSTIYFDIEVVKSYNPFFKHSHSDTLYGLDKQKFLFKKRGSPVLISEEEIALFHMVSYFFNQNGKPVLVNSTRIANKPMTLRPGAKGHSNGLNQAFKYLHKGDSVTLHIPAAQSAKENSSKQICFDIEVLDVFPYPFFEPVNRDTVFRLQNLKYLVVRPGTGDVENDSCELTFNYTGYRIEKTGKKIIFDATRESGQMLTIQLEKQQVIAGFEKGVKDMKLGEGRILIIPPQLAYGSMGVPAAGIPPGATLYFDVELVQRKKINENKKH